MIPPSTNPRGCASRQAYGKSHGLPELSNIGRVAWAEDDFKALSQGRSAK
ncbi:hypothetical protein P3T32_002020 [Ralstonia sp. GP73]|uniref:Uncharacterized protein n=2 Tax=Ralstonia TaxID=48736 RepID=A0AAD2F0N4_9RALS|nr:hypothetical protein [Ralstonia sp. GP73]CAJ0708729.1 hypothetical protein LMG7143_00809 [Ralstonia sp. LMG 18095]CAJ0795968.1 hypothetical protein R77560_02805 [Ralstonia sp. LMG 18095]CAJ0805996.1 hypothetical protein LMG18095_04360 [Ralstonia sp. LMG 18095]CAJ0858142.1 hypothetical protein R6138_00524 [Ralstonia sp. LMG 18095]